MNQHQVRWDWHIAFNFTYEGSPVAGEMFYKETEAATYTLAILYAEGSEFPEGFAVIDSFTVE